MTDDELKAIEARCAAATPGPWEVVSDRRNSVDLENDLICPARVICASTEFPVRTRGQRICEGGMPDLQTRGRDYGFIAAARSDIPALLAEVRRLRHEMSDEHVSPLFVRAVLEAPNAIIKDQAERIAALEARVASAEAIVNFIEWVRLNDVFECLFCARIKGGGHAPGCRIGKHRKAFP